jgi:ribose 5-phosphate isomerase RpiB
MKKKLIFLLAILILSGCETAKPAIILTPAVIAKTPMPTATLQLTVLPITTPEPSAYDFPVSIDPSQQYLFYLHGKIIEDQGIHAISPDYGEYEYEAILDKLSNYGFEVISEQRPKNTDSVEYAKKIAEQVKSLLNAGVQAEDITIVGASKGADIAIYVSHFLENKEINFVIMGTCHPDDVEFLKQNDIFVYGNVLAIFDSVDELSSSCQELFAFSEARGISRHGEIVLHIGTGHGVLYKPLDEWVVPVVQWARGR